MAGDLDGKVVIITGAAGGIGRVTAERCIAHGARVVVSDVDDAAGQQLAVELGERAAFHHTDVSDREQVQALVDVAVARFGGLDVMVNNAGVSGSRRRFLDDDLRDFQQVVNIDLFGVLIGSQLAARHMAQRGGGSIINIASGAGITPGIGMQPYRAAKAGVVQFSRSIAVELGEHNIRVNCLAPANIATDINAVFDKAAVLRLQPLPHQGTPIDVAESVVYLASDRSAHITGVVLAIDGGMAVGTPPVFFAKPRSS